MYIVHIATELAPIAKVGGLGDMIQGLGRALSEEGAQVEIILPFYDTICRQSLSHLKVEIDRLFLFENKTKCSNRVWSAKFDGFALTLIETDHKQYFDRGKIYGEKDDDLRFIYFSSVALEYLLKAKKSPDILNLHDWLTSLCAPLYREIYAPRGLKIKKVITTIHNMLYQGKCSVEKLTAIGLPSKLDKMQDHKKSQLLNLLKGAIIYSDFLTTVSPSYAKEIEGNKGYGLGSLLIENREKFKGILNGIDTKYWNPATDVFLQKNYPSNFTFIEDVLKAKKMNRKYLSKIMNLKSNQTPLFIVITRLVKQKGPKLIEHGLNYILEKGGQFILLGTPYEDDIRAQFKALSEKYRDHVNIHFYFEYDEGLAHLAYASADFILIPSLFEPCGLTQMIALQYGTIPIVHQVGGLKDSIFDIDDNKVPMEKRNGYIFNLPSKEHLNSSIDRAFKDFKYEKKKWLTMVSNGLKKDWSWKNSALEYLKLYQTILSKS